MFRHLDKSKFLSLIETLSKRDKREVQRYISQFISSEIEEAARIEEAKGKILK